MTNICSDKHNFVTASLLLLWQTCVCCKKICLFVMTKVWLLWQTCACCDEMFVATIFLFVAAPANDNRSAQLLLPVPAMIILWSPETWNQAMVLLQVEGWAGVGWRGALGLAWWYWQTRWGSYSYLFLSWLYCLCTGVARSPEVVLLQVGPTWGSGVIVDQLRGVILTCSHVVKEAHLHPGTWRFQVICIPEWPFDCCNVSEYILSSLN